MKEQSLTLVGLTEDKQRLVLVNDAGEEFTLPADARLRAALRGEHARLGQLEITMESALRPRDIQARIRAGESPESVAAAAQTSLDKVMGYATPVLAERAHIAQRAQQASVRRRAGDGPARVLVDAVAERLRARNVDPASVEWDAWRREDGRWTLVADYQSGESTRHAEFVFDAPGRFVLAEDDEARWLVGEQQASSRGPQPRGATGPRRLSAVDAGSARSDDELPLGEDAIELVAEPPEQPSEQPSEQPRSEAGDEATEDLSATAAALRAPDPVGTGDADWIATQASERPVPDADPSDPLADDERAELGSEADEPDAAGEGAAGEGHDAASADEPAKRTSKKGRRPSVPSWDEIMFGGGKRD